MAAKYYVWGEGVWREVDVASGRVSGWRRRARFVFVRRGRLLLARHRPVLRALQALAKGAPGSAADGPRLSHRSKVEHRSKPSRKSPVVADAPPVAPEPAAPPPAPVHQQHCCIHNRCVDNDKQDPAPPSPSTPRPAAAGSLGRRDMSSQCHLPRAGSTAHGLTINVPHATPPTTTTTSAPTNAVVPTVTDSSADELVSTFMRRAVRTNTSGLNALLERHATTIKESSHKKDKTSARAQRVKKRAGDVSSEKTDSSGSEPACKELLVSDGDVAAVRAYVCARFPDAVQRFDADEEYKRLLFYSINPLVEVERSARLERLLSQHAAAALPHFAARLGLTPRSSSTAPAPAPSPAPPRLRPGPVRRRRERSTSADTDKENKDKYSSPNTRRRGRPVAVVKKSPQLKPTPAASEPAPSRASRQGVSERSNKQKKDVLIKAAETNGDTSDPPRAKRPAVAAAPASLVRAPPAHVISQRASQANAKEYSNLEDHAIVAWVSSGNRATLVSGNRIWRELQEQYERLTGRERSWHSLRNRYLRYILPALGALHLPPADVSRLRAAAATGVIKTRHRPAPKRHSMFAEPERGASSRSLRSAGAREEASPAKEKVAGDSDDPSPPKRRSLRIQPQETGDRHEGSNDSTSKDPVSKAGGSHPSNTKESASKASRTKEVGSKKTGSNKTRSPRYSDVTRRFAARHRSRSPSPRSPSSSPRSPSPVLEPTTRSRRLFNPNAKV